MKERRRTGEGGSGRRQAVLFMLLWAGARVAAGADAEPAPQAPDHPSVPIDITTWEVLDAHDGPWTAERALPVLKALDAWSTAAEDPLCRVPGSAELFRCRSMTVREWIDGLPPEKRRMLSQFFDPKASALLTRWQSEADATALWGAVERFGWADPGRRACAAAAARRFDEADFYTAGRLWDAADPTRSNPNRIGRAALAYLLAGRDDLYAARRKRLEEAHGSAQTVCGDVTTSWMEAVREAPDRAFVSVAADGLDETAPVSALPLLRADLKAGATHVRKAHIGQDWVLLRNREAVRAFPLAGGGRPWAMVGQRPVACDSMRVAELDLRWSRRDDMRDVTVGGGLLFAVSNIRQSMPESRMGMLRRLQVGSKLAAASLADQGRILWSVGLGRGDTDVLRRGLYGSAPAYADGNVIVVVMDAGQYYLCILDATTGRGVGETCLIVRSRDVDTARNRLPPGTPLVVRGTAYVNTQAGAVFSVRLADGRINWARLYEKTPGSRRAVSTHHAGSPVLVAARLLTLPADGTDLLALDPIDGTLLWRQGRQGQSRLLPYDDQHVLLCSPDLVVVNASDGTVAARKNVGRKELRAWVSDGVVVATDGRRTYRWRPELARRVPRFRAHRRAPSAASTQPGLVIETSEGIRLLAGGEAQHGR